MAGKRGNGEFLHPGHPGVVIFGNLIRDRISGLTTLKGPGWGFGAKPSRDTLFGHPFWAFVLPWVILRGFWPVWQKSVKIGQNVSKSLNLLILLTKSGPTRHAPGSNR